MNKRKTTLAIDCKTLLDKYIELEASHTNLCEKHADLNTEIQCHKEENKNVQEQIVALQQENKTLKIETEDLNAKHTDLNKVHEISVIEIEKHLETSKETQALIEKIRTRQR